MKIIIAPDSFKGSLRSPEVCAALCRGLRSALPEAELVALPLADGGEGTTRVLVAATGGTLHEVTVHGPLMDPVAALYGITGDRTCAVIEMAAASGIELLAPERLDPLRATTFGVGELVRAILDTGVSTLLFGIGGSASVDGGAGMAQALGARFFDAQGELLPDGIGGGELERIAAVDFAALDPRLRNINVKVGCDVTNPLLGPRGAAAVFGPQKGAGPAAVARLERNLAHWRGLLQAAGVTDAADRPGDGAAGGLGFALRVIYQGELASGAALVIEAVGLRRELRDADLLITGEGRTDNQTAGGKLCSVVAEAAAAAGVPAILASGAVSGDPDVLHRYFAAAFSIARGPGSLAGAMRDTAANLELFGANLGALLRLGGGSAGAEGVRGMPVGELSSP
jgi:glycerate kinase